MVDLFYVDGMRLLLDACAETLETVVLDPQDPCGEQFSLKGVQALANNLAARPSLRNFDLSRNKSLRALGIPASSIVAHQTPLLFLSTCSRQSHPLRSPRSSSFIATATSVTQDAGTQLRFSTAIYHKPRKRWRPHGIVGDWRYYARSITCRNFGWSCGRVFGVL